jgi:TolB-like protein/DNA-binding winged helix-turn-helix (wHTH) protein
LDAKRREDAVTRARTKYSFGPFEFDLASGELFRDGERTKLQGRPVEVLALLIERAGELVTRDELKARLWAADTFVDFDNNLNATVRKLREALGDSADAARYIETLPRRGYRFIAPLMLVDPLLAIGDRPRDAASHRAWLRGALRVVLAATVILVLGLSAQLWQKESFQVHEDLVLVAVLPFENLSGDPGQDFIGDGLGAELAGQLGSVQGHRFRMVARSSTSRYRGSRKSAPEVGRELPADFLVEGSARQDASGLYVTAHLVRAEDGKTLWNGSFACPRRDLFAIQHQLAAKIRPYLVDNIR